MEGTDAAMVGRVIKMPGFEVRFMSMVAIWWGLIVLQCILGPMRRHSGHWFVQYGAMAAYYLPMPLLTYVVYDLRCSTHADLRYLHLVCGQIFVTYVLVPFFFGMRVYSVGHTSNWRYLKLLFHLLVLFSLSSKFGSSPRVIFDSIVQMLMVAVCPISLKPFRDIMEARSRIYAGYMVSESKSAPSFFQEQNSQAPMFHGTANGLERCKYPFIPGTEMTWVKINDMLQCGVPDMCLSYSFSQLLTRRYFGLECAEEGDPKVRNFVLMELLQDYKRAFTIVEVQLAFFHDTFFRSYMVTLFLDWPELHRRIAKRPWLFTMFIWLLPCFIVTASAKNEIPLITVIAVSLPIYIIVSWLEKEQLLATDWYVLSSAVQSYAAGSAYKPSRQKQKTWSKRPYWKNKIGQYSIIKSSSYRRSARKTILAVLEEIITLKWKFVAFDHLPVEDASVSLPDSVRDLIARVLRDINGRPTNGTRSLERNRYFLPDDLSWTCRQRHHTHTILIWHIATCYCDIMFAQEETITSDREAATALSRYCAYLVAFLPELLPGDRLKTKTALHDVLCEAQTLLRSTMSMEEKRTRIRGLQLPQNENWMSTFQKGIKLGRQLEKLDTLVGWKVMAEFWAEAILHAAPSDDAAAHIGRLAKGGEFTTHLWALLSNAGMAPLSGQRMSSRKRHSLLCTSCEPSAQCTSDSTV